MKLGWWRVAGNGHASAWQPRAILCALDLKGSPFRAEKKQDHLVSGLVSQEPLSSASRLQGMGVLELLTLGEQVVNLRHEVSEKK